MTYSPPTSSENSAAYTGWLNLPDVEGFAGLQLNFSLTAMPSSNEGSLDDTFQALIDHLAAFPGVTAFGASKSYPTSQTVTPTEEPTE